MVGHLALVKNRSSHHKRPELLTDVQWPRDDWPYFSQVSFSLRPTSLLVCNRTLGIKRDHLSKSSTHKFFDAWI